MLRALQSNGSYSRTAYQQAFRDHFGYGGTFVGYIDRATRDTLNTLATMEDDAQEYPGSQDTQLPAVSKLPALVARHHGDALENMVEDAVRVTNNNDLSVRYAQVSAQLLADILRTGTLPDLTKLANGTEDDVAGPITTALNDPDSTEDVTAKIGLSCYLNYGVPSVFHNLSNATSFTDAIRTNIYAGGDNCGRAVLLGAAMGALHGIGGDTGIPQTWIDKLTRKSEIEVFANTLA